MLFASIGWTILCAEHALASRLPPWLDGRDLRLAGWVDDFPDVRPDRTVFALRIDRGAAATAVERVRLTWYDDAPALNPGDPVEIVARLRQPRGLHNPGGWDYERWLLLQSFDATGYVRFGTVDADRRHDRRAAWLAVRSQIAQRIEKVGGRSGGSSLVTALAIGERSRFDERAWDAFRRTGTTHLVAISGLHVGLVAGFVLIVVRRSLRAVAARTNLPDLECAAGTAAVAGLIYAALAGFSLPTLRAVIMLVFGLIVLCSRRHVDTLSALSLAVIFLLAMDPLATLSGSFWMSCGAVAALLLLVKVRRRSLHGSAFGMVISAALDLARLQSLLFVALIPIVWVSFGELSVLGVAVNIVAIPLFSVVLVPASLATALNVSVLPQFSQIPEATIELADWTMQALLALASIDATSIGLPPVTWATWLPVAAGLLLLLPWHPLPARYLGWLAILPLIRTADSQDTPFGEFELMVLDVGHGLAVIVTTHAHRLVYDAGPLTRSGFDTGSEIVIPALFHRSTRAPDTIIVSHSDNDHSGGANALVAAFPHARRMLGPDVDTVSGDRCRVGQRWQWDGVEFSILHPPIGFPASGNDNSCVLKVASTSGTALLTGDIESRGERALLTGAELSADVVIVPHHGSATSSSPAFVTATRPTLAIVSAAHRNRWGFPKPEIVDRWLRSGADVVVTGELGAIEVRWQRGEPRWRSWRNVDRRYWHAPALSVSGATSAGAL